MKIFAISVKSNGLYGKAFAVGCTAMNDGAIEDQDMLRREFNDDEEICDYCKEHELKEIYKLNKGTITNNWKSFLYSFSRIYLKYKNLGYTIVCHMGVPVISKLFLEAHDNGYLGDNDLPYPLVDISAFPEIGDSVDRFLEKFEKVDTSVYGGPCHPIYDSLAIARAYNNWICKYELLINKI